VTDLSTAGSARGSVDRRPGVTIWLTGLSGAGKSTVSTLLAEALESAGRRVEVLDGDVVRTHLSAGLGFSRADRDTNVRRVGWVCALLNRHGVDAIAALVSPYREAREQLRAEIPSFVEVHMDCSLDVLVQRDVKGLYKKALAGEIANFTGVSDPYEPPLAPDLHLHTDAQGVGDSILEVIAALRERQLVGDDVEQLLAPTFR
jgi:adenylyl-sulfate kinase